MTNNQEIEAKFILPNEDVAARLSTINPIASGFFASVATHKPNIDVYYDSPENTLLNNSLGLRVRATSAKTVVTAKSISEAQDSAVLHRVEIECVVDPSVGTAPYLDQTVPELQQLVDRYNPDGRPLAPILVLQQTRSKRIVHARSDAAQTASAPKLAELSLDYVRVFSSTGNKTSLDSFLQEVPITEFRELELELLPGGDYEQLLQLVAALVAEYGLRKSGMSKLEAGLRAVANSAPSAG